MQARTPVLLAILDGIGIAEPSDTNALTSANAPYLHELFFGGKYPCRTLAASGRDVGLPAGQMGNSEVGHLNIGAGRVVNQELTRIDCAVEDGSLAQNPALVHALTAARDAGQTVHFMGLLSDGGVHSEQAHLEALVALAAGLGCDRLRIHVFLDGRDVAPTSGKGYMEKLEAFCLQQLAQHPGISLRVASVQGRYWAMDRDKRWERVERGWKAIVAPVEPDVQSVLSSQSAASVVQAAYDAGTTDEFVEPVAIGTEGVVDGDTVVFYNFRPDRAREITRAFIDPDFDSYGFKRCTVPAVHFVCMTEYDPAFAEEMGAAVAFPKSFPENVLADYLASLGLRQLHIAETEKYAHVTFFFNGGVEEPKPGEERVLIPSPKVATYDLQPQMSAPEVTDALVDAISRDAADVYIVNYANGDMVGHTGVVAAARAAVEAVSAGLERVVEALIARGGQALITADHGNCERMVSADGTPWTAHTTNPVPLVLIADKGVALETQQPARLADIAPTLLDLMGLPAPAEFTGRSLLVRE